MNPVRLCNVPVQRCTCRPGESRIIHSVDPRPIRLPPQGHEEHRAVQRPFRGQSWLSGTLTMIGSMASCQTWSSSSWCICTDTSGQSNWQQHVAAAIGAVQRCRCSLEQQHIVLHRSNSLRGFCSAGLFGGGVDPVLACWLLLGAHL